MTKLPYGCADEDGLYHITGNFMTKPKPYTKEELKWARKQAKLLGVKGGPEAFLEMRWSEVSQLAAEKGLTWVIQGLPAPGGGTLPAIPLSPTPSASRGRKPRRPSRRSCRK